MTLDEERISLYKYNFFKSFFLYYFVMLYFLYQAVFGKKNKNKKKFDVILHLGDGIEEYYQNIYKALQNRKFGILITSLYDKKIQGNLNNIQDVFESIASLTNSFSKKISKIIVFKQFFSFFKFYHISKTINFDVVTIVLKLQKQLAVAVTDVEQLSSKVFVSAYSNEFGPLRYYIYKQNLGSIFIIENGRINYKNKQCHGYCYTDSDYYIAMDTSLDRDKMFLCSKEFKYWGSLLLDNSILEYKNKNYQIEYDVLFLEQVLTMPCCFQDYILALEYLSEFSKKHPELKVGYRFASNKRKNLCTEGKKLVDIYDDIIENSHIIIDDKNSKDSYESLFKAKTIVYYNSTLGAEALMLDKVVLNINFDKLHSAILTEDDSMCMLFDRSYEKFEAKLLNLISQDERVVRFYKNLKNEISFQEPNLNEKLIELIKIEIDK